MKGKDVSENIGKRPFVLKIGKFVIIFLRMRKGQKIMLTESSIELSYTSDGRKDNDSGGN